MIKEILIIAVCFLSTNITAGQSIFKTIEIKWGEYDENRPPPIKEQNAKYYSIGLEKDSGFTVIYPTVYDPGASFDTLLAIKELLAYKGDTRICGIPVTGYCLICSDWYRGDKYYYSLQLQALYIINQLVYDPKLIHNPYPVLFDDKSKKEITVDEEGITRLFDAYIEWYEKVKYMTMAEIRKFDEKPYKVAEVYWTR